MKRKNSIDITRNLGGFVIDQLDRRKGEWPAISKASGVPYFTISKISNGTTADPKTSTVQKLANYFLDNPIAA